jgi:hypothetical protein
MKPSKSSESVLLDRNLVAERWSRCHPATVKRKERRPGFEQGLIPIRIGGRVLYKVSDVERFEREAAGAPTQQ